MTFKKLIKAIWRIFTQRAWLKLLSILLALILWAYIIGNNTSLTRNKTLTGISVNVGSTNNLTSRSLALLTDVYTEYQKEITAVVNVPQSRFASVTSSMVRVTPDYSGISRPGTYDIPITATCSYGSVVRLSRDTITVVIEDLDTRDIPVEITYENRDNENYWYTYDPASINPQMVTISGPASIIQNITGANISMDVRNRTGSFRRSQVVRFTDSEGSQIISKQLTKSSTTCSVQVDIYPKKVLEVQLDRSQFNVPEGYEITSVTCVPSTITIAAEQDLLDSMEYMPLELPESLTSVTNTKTARVSVGGIEDFKYISSKQVYVTVTVSEINSQKTEEQ